MHLHLAHHATLEGNHFSIFFELNEEHEDVENIEYFRIDSQFLVLFQVLKSGTAIKLPMH